jgi:hypothetical protein
MSRVWRAALVMLGVMMAVTGCKSLSCNAPPEYGNADSIPSLKIPPGLDAPDTRGGLKVPELGTPDRPRADAEGCLDEPPSYFPERVRGDFPKGDRPQPPQPTGQAPQPPPKTPEPTT